MADEQTAPAPEQVGYPHWTTMAICVPWSGRPLPPELVLGFKSNTPPMATNGIYFETKGAPIADARNSFAERAIEYKAKYLFFWDEDVLIPPHLLRELTFVLENWPDVGVVGGIYCLKTDRPEPLVFKGAGKGPYWDWKVGEIFECDGIGMGCTLIRTDVFKDVDKPWFRTVDDTSRYLDNIPFVEGWTEDLWFCDRLRKTKKWKILAHGQLLCAHVDVRTGRRYELPPDSKPMRTTTTFKNGQKRILDVGCGTNPHKTNEGKVVTVDIRDDVGADYVTDFRKLPFATHSFDIVHSSHSLEHIPRKSQEETLDEWVRVLKPDGEMRLTVPDLEWAAKRVMAGEMGVAKNTDVGALDVFYGQQKYPTDFHYGGFTEKSLTELLKARGFNKFEVDRLAFHLKMRAWRTPDKKNGKVNGHEPPPRNGNQKRRDIKLAHRGGHKRPDDGGVPAGQKR